MRVQHDDVRVRVIGKNGRKHQRNGAGFSRAGGAEYGKVLRQQLVDKHKSRLSRIVVEASDADVGSRWPGVNRRQIGCSCSSDGGARDGMTGYASVELALPLPRRDDLSQ